MTHLRFFSAVLLALTGLAGVVVVRKELRRSEAVLSSGAPAVSFDPRALVLAPHRGSEPIDAQIGAAQQRAAGAADGRALEKLGWLFVQKARLSNDPGFYKLAEQCALAMEHEHPRQPDALLLRGHAAEAMHHFREAEMIARQLVQEREFLLDFALLGDALMEQGRLDEAAAAYQKMADLKPCLQTYNRVAHLRWLKGDLEGAIEMAEFAVRTGDDRDPEPLAWSLAKLGAYRLESAELPQAAAAIDRALALLPHYAPALLLRGRWCLAENQPAAAVAALREAARLNPLPDYQWTLAEALRSAGEEKDAVAVESELAARGEAADRRTYALYLATHRRHSEEAVRLAEEELRERQDVFTHDALAWAYFAAGRTADALASTRKALVEGTQDARLQLHAGLIAAAAGTGDAEVRLRAADAARWMLLPSERALLVSALETRRTAALSTDSDTEKNPNEKP